MTTTARSPETPIPYQSPLGRITSRWWQILLLWIVSSSFLLYLIGSDVQPTFRSV